MQRYKKILSTALLVLGISGLIGTTLAPATYGLNAKEEVCSGLDETAGTTGCGADTGRSVPELVGSIISILMYVVGAISVIMIIIGGVRYVLSNGDSNGVQGAKNTILYALVGLVIAIFAQVIVAFVINRS